MENAIIIELTIREALIHTFNQTIWDILLTQSQEHIIKKYDDQCDASFLVISRKSNITHVLPDTDHF